MNPELISRIVGLLKKEGDRLILADSATGKTVVIMDLAQYESLSSSGVTAFAVPAPVIEPREPRMEKEPAMEFARPMAPQGTAYREPGESYSLPPPEPRIAPRLEPRMEPRVEAPSFAPPLVRKIEEPMAVKMAKKSENPFAKRARQLGVEETLDPMDLADLTQTELLDKINRDIGDWKTAQERKRSDVLQSAARPTRRFEADTVVQEEERFYLEPIE